MKKILQINSVINFGSTGHIVEDLGILFKDNNWESYVLYGRNKRESHSRLIFVGNFFSFIFHLFYSYCFDLHGKASVFRTRISLRKIKQIKPDIIHLHNIHGYYINYSLLFNYLKKEKAVVIWTLHDCWSYTGHCCYYTLKKCNKWQQQCFSCPQKKQYPKSLFFDNSKNNYISKKKYFSSLDNLTIVTPSKWLADEVKKSFLKKYKVVTIYNGIDLSIFLPSINNPYANFNIQNKKIILGVSNVWETRKGLYDFYELNNLLDSNKFQIVLVGLNKKQIKQLPINIIGIERTESIEKLVDFYSFADVYFNASVEETLGLTTVEAQACGTPCIVYNSTAIPETIIDGKTGIIIEPNNVKAVYSAIEKITSVPKSSYSAACIEWVKTTFDKNKNYQQYIDLYKSILNCQE